MQKRIELVDVGIAFLILAMGFAVGLVLIQIVHGENKTLLVVTASILECTDNGTICNVLSTKTEEREIVLDLYDPCTPQTPCSGA